MCLPGGDGGGKKQREGAGEKCVIIKEVKKDYQSALAHPAKAGTVPAWPLRYSPAALLFWATLSPSSVKTATAFQTVWRHGCSLLRTIPQMWGTIQVGMFHKYQRDAEVGLNMKAGEMIFTNEQLMPREVKWFSQSKIHPKPKPLQVILIFLWQHSSNFSVHVIYLEAHLKRTGSGWGLWFCTYWLPADASTPWTTLGEARVYSTERGPLCVSGPQVHLGSPEQNGDLLQCCLPTHAHPPTKGVDALHKRPAVSETVLIRLLRAPWLYEQPNE